MDWSDLGDRMTRAFAAAADYAADAATPVLRLGVTGLSRSGKTVFITALVHALTRGGRLPLFDALSEGRITSGVLDPQPDDAVPRFDYETHLRTLVEARDWPQSTRQISELRITLSFASRNPLTRVLGGGRLHLDIVDYPGEWLVDLPLLNKDYATWSAESLVRARHPERRAIAAPFLAAAAGVDPFAPEDEPLARQLAERFRDYLREARRDGLALSALPPGRFLMAGDLEGSPALTFAPLDIGDRRPPARSLAAMMQRRYEAYKDVVVRPFFRDHFARLDRQIVLVDMLQALNAGPAAMSDLKEALADIMACFRPGRSSWLAALTGRRIDRILFAATKADLVHSSNHDRLQAILKRLVEDAIGTAEDAGAGVDAVALAAVRATREAVVQVGGERLPVLSGVPQEGETMSGDRFDGHSEIAIFPGDLPGNPDSVFHHGASHPPGTPIAGPPAMPGAQHLHEPASDAPFEPLEPPLESIVDLNLDLNFIRFRPPLLERLSAPATGTADPALPAEPALLALPHIRLDRALQFLLGDRLL